MLQIFLRTSKQSRCKDSYRILSFVSNGIPAPSKRSAVVGDLYEGGAVLGGVRREVVQDSVQAKFNPTIVQSTKILSACTSSNVYIVPNCGR